MSMERRRLKSPLIERATPRDAALHVRSFDPQAPTAHATGYAATVNEPYGPVRDWLGEYTERILSRAFSKTLQEKGGPGRASGIPLLLNHDQNLLLANTNSGTSRLEEDSRGLKNDADLDMRQSLGRDTAFQLERGDLSKMSFSFRATKDLWNADYTDRQVQEAELFDTSIVLSPANPSTIVELREMMRTALGREGRSLWLSDSDFSIRSALPVMLQHDSLDPNEESLVEQALRALEAADTAVASRAFQARSRTFRVAQAMRDLRQGKTLSSANQTLLKQAADALAAADKHHQKLLDSHASAAGKVQQVLDAATAEASNSGTESAANGMSNGTPPDGGNPITPLDGAGPRSQSLKLQRHREAEIRAIRGDAAGRALTPGLRSLELKLQRDAELRQLARDKGAGPRPVTAAEASLARQMRAVLFAQSQVGGGR